jgi:hypothetical protein
MDILLSMQQSYATLVDSLSPMIVMMLMALRLDIWDTMFGLLLLRQDMIHKRYDDMEFGPIHC